MRPVAPHQQAAGSRPPRTPPAKPDPTDQTSATQTDGDDALVSSFGYQRQFARTLHSFGSFAVAFSFISITTGIFSTFSFVLTAGGPRGIWTWPIAVVGQILVALVYGMLASKIPLSGYSYQWAARLADPHVGWWFGWVSFAFLSIVTVSVDYGLTQSALLPLLGIAYTPTAGMVGTLLVLLVQAALIIWSTRITTGVNNIAVITEVVGIVGLTVALAAVALIAGDADWGNLSATGAVPAEGYFGLLGPFMLATLLGAYTIVGFESAANLAEETRDPRRVIPRAMVRSIVVSGLLGMVFLIALVIAMPDVAQVTAESSPVAAIVAANLGPIPRALALSLVCVSIFACGLVIMVSNSRLIHSMARDGRLPGSTVLSTVPRATGGPLWATVTAVGVSAAIVVGFGFNASALADLLSASTLMPAILYAGTVLLFIVSLRRFPARPGDFTLGRWTWPVVTLALVWLAYELVILLVPADFRPAQFYALGTVAVGVVCYLWLRLTRPAAFRRDTAGAAR